MRMKQARSGKAFARGHHGKAERIIPTGAIAQLAERRTRIAEVESSSLFRSTTRIRVSAGRPAWPPLRMAVALLAVQDRRAAVGTGKCTRRSRIPTAGHSFL